MGTNTNNTARKVRIPIRTEKHRTPKAASRGRKAAAKLGMTGSLGALFVSGFFKFKGAKSLHVYSGFGLLAFTVWHHYLNRPKRRLKP
ncbi:MAG: hypothetical protein QNJ61_14465 [Desulfobacterales bacterium]|nr:hypothetical protein [Desulfobacterales bacterium]